MSPSSSISHYKGSNHVTFVSQVMSLVILGGFVLFAVFLAMLYLNVTTKDSSNNLIPDSSVGKFLIRFFASI